MFFFFCILDFSFVFIIIIVVIWLQHNWNFFFCLNIIRTKSWEYVCKSIYFGLLPSIFDRTNWSVHDYDDKGYCLIDIYIFFISFYIFIFVCLCNCGLAWLDWKTCKYSIIIWTIVMMILQNQENIRILFEWLGFWLFRFQGNIRIFIAVNANRICEILLVLFLF